MPLTPDFFIDSDLIFDRESCGSYLSVAPLNLNAVHFGGTRFLWGCSLEIFFVVGHEGHGLPLGLRGLAIESCGDRDRFLCRGHGGLPLSLRGLAIESCGDRDRILNFSTTQIGQILDPSIWGSRRS